MSDNCSKRLGLRVELSVPVKTCSWYFLGSSASRLAKEQQEAEDNEIDMKVDETLKDISDQDHEDYLDLDLNEEAELVNKYRLLIASFHQTW